LKSEKFEKGKRMNQTLFLLGLSVVLVFSSCARNERRAPAYNSTQCPFCTVHPGTCSYCTGTGKCAYCQGTGKRLVMWPNIPEENITFGSYGEQCSFCKGTGTCQYCGGKDKCWACKGSGAIHSWDFYGEYKGATSK
jgi:DnaJ-class molecular chaperone